MSKSVQKFAVFGKIFTTSAFVYKLFDKISALFSKSPFY